MKPYYTLAEAAAEAGISARRMRLLCEQGRVYYAEKIGRFWIVQLNFHIDRQANGRPRKKVPPYAQSKSATK